MVEVAFFHFFLRGDFCFFRRFQRALQFLPHLEGIHGIVEACLVGQVVSYIVDDLFDSLHGGSLEYPLKRDLF